MNQHLQEIRNHNSEIERIKLAIAQAIRDLPDNPNIQRISERPRCFTISSNDLFGKNNSTADMRVRNNWSVFYHDFKAQYKRIAELIERARPENILPQLKTIIDTGHLKGKDYVEFHPQVVKHIKQLIKE